MNPFLPLCYICETFVNIVGIQRSVCLTGHKVLFRVERSKRSLGTMKFVYVAMVTKILILTVSMFALFA